MQGDAKVFEFGDGGDGLAAKRSPAASPAAGLPVRAPLSSTTLALAVLTVSPNCPQ